jgi:hypothetical protein
MVYDTLEKHQQRGWVLSEVMEASHPLPEVKE